MQELSRMLRRKLSRWSRTHSIKNGDHYGRQYILFKNYICKPCVLFRKMPFIMIVPEYDGQKEILAHHEDMVIAIDEGEMRFQPEGTDNWEYAVVGMGFVEIVNNRVTLLVETAERPEEIDVARAREAKERAEEQMRQKQSIREYYHSRASLSRAMARLKGTSGRK